jgi:hypothetical protein
MPEKGDMAMPWLPRNPARVGQAQLAATMPTIIGSEILGSRFVEAELYA